MESKWKVFNSNSTNIAENSFQSFILPIINPIISEVLQEVLCPKVAVLKDCTKFSGKTRLYESYLLISPGTFKVWTFGSDDKTLLKCFRVIFSLKKQTIQFSFAFNLYFQQKRAPKLSICHLLMKSSV